MRALVWFRADLRTRDHPALYHACRDATRGVIGVFLLAHDQWSVHEWGPARIDFLLRSLEALRTDLTKISVPLLVLEAPTFRDAPRVLVDAARSHACDVVSFNREYEVNEARRDDAVEAALARAGLRVQRYHDQVLLVPGDVRTGEGKFYTVFTPFRKACAARLEEQGVVALGAPRRQDAPCIVVREDPIASETPASRPDLWPAGEHEAAARLKRFIATRLGAYDEARDLPGEPGTSELSPYLACGAVSIRQCMRSVLEANDGRFTSGEPGALQWMSELLWREFYRHIIVGFPRVCMGRAFRLETERIRWDENHAYFDAWREGRTGFPIVDAGMRQLRRTGWMHNRLRMITAMFLTKDLFLHWRHGEKHFMNTLIDADLANNNGGWQWCASTGNDAAPYFRIFNPISQGLKCDPDGTYIRRFVPELAHLKGDALHQPWTLPPLPRGRIDYPEPIVDRTRTKARVVAAFKALKSS